ncbi:MAG: Dyp-type peroxidase [Chloroflexi bacterium]|nr:Dyp-type peroxidase [Chloroflexota bacterium]
MPDQPEEGGRRRGPRPRLSRRAFLKAGAVAGGAAALTGGSVLLTACGDDDDDSAAVIDPEEIEPRFVDFYGPHQTGITARPVPTLGLMASFKVLSPDRESLRDTFVELTDEIQGLMAGRPPTIRPEAYPPTDSGLLGAEPEPDDLSVVVSVGSSLFDDRYGLADKQPVELVRMPFLANDRLDPARTHGDLLLNIDARHPDTIQFALRQLMRRRRRDLVLHWIIDGYTRGGTVNDGTAGAPRNLLGFKDGTANLDSSDDEAMNRFVWIQPEDNQPEWSIGGSYQAVRIIRMFVEFWDRTPLAEQEAIMGRHKLSGAPLGQVHESDTPSFSNDPDGETTPLDAHIRLANPRTAATDESLIFRRGFSYTRGYDGAGRLDMGLAFVSYQRSFVKGFLAVQERLAGEPLEEYILPEGGGFFFALPGVPEPGRYLGDGLFA